MPVRCENHQLYDAPTPNSEQKNKFLLFLMIIILRQSLLNYIMIMFRYEVREQIQNRLDLRSCLRGKTLSPVLYFSWHSCDSNQRFTVLRNMFSEPKAYLISDIEVKIENYTNQFSSN